ncbi:MAG: hypothetical protein JW969_17070 [Spirochaetales bacterium]|nr:hypothetical protein [Spirochaetales bacterium]
MEYNQKVLFVDTHSGYYKIKHYPLPAFMGPVDLGLHLASKYKTMNIGIGMLAGSIFPGSNRLIFNGFSPCWGGFYISSMGGAGLIFENLGINILSLVGKAQEPSVLYLNRRHGEEIDVKLRPLDLETIWENGRGGVYALMDHVMEQFGGNYEGDPQILATGPASLTSDIGSVVSVHIKNKKLSFVDTWAGRGGMGTKMLSEHGIAAIIYGGTFIDEDFRNRKVADEWFQAKYDQKLLAKDLEDTTKYRFDPKFGTGGTFGVNYAMLAGKIMAFNYKTIYMDEQQRLDIHKKLITDHYLKQFNEETISTKQFKTCGEPCTAVCKKMKGEFKKDYEPYQTMGPLCGVFDMRAAEKLNHTADTYGFDAISVGGVLSWLMDCVSEKLLTKEEAGISGEPVFSPEGFSVVTDSKNNAELGVELLNNIIHKKTDIDFTEGARKAARRLARTKKNKRILDLFVYNAYARKGWMVPNQYWTPGVLSPMPIMGKYYMYYGTDFFPPRELGRKNAQHFLSELVLDNTGICRFHRKWASDLLPEIVNSIFGYKDEVTQSASMTASRINSRNSSVFWESERNMDYIHTFLLRKHIVEENNDPELLKWLDLFKKDKVEASLNFWYEMHKGTHESLREF